jgi:hypothetical protein
LIAVVSTLIERTTTSGAGDDESNRSSGYRPKQSGEAHGVIVALAPDSGKLTNGRFD